jgi:hypothetical protein
VNTFSPFKDSCWALPCMLCAFCSGGAFLCVIACHMPMGDAAAAECVARMCINAHIEAWAGQCYVHEMHCVCMIRLIWSQVSLCSAAESLSRKHRESTYMKIKLALHDCSPSNVQLRLSHVKSVTPPCCVQNNQLVGPAVLRN